MAGFYLHNAIFTPEPSEIIRASSIFAHSRNPSTATSTTLHGNASDQSHTHEPLLHSSTSDPWSYIPPLTRQHDSADESAHFAWGSPPALFEEPPALRKTKIFWEKKTQGRLRRMRYFMRSLEVLFGVWAIYNTVRYFLAFKKYDSAEGQHTSLALGICASVSFGLLAAAAVFNFVRLRRLMHAAPLRLVTIFTVSSLCISSVMLLTPAVVNMVILFAWRNHFERELSTEARCQVDIDVVWSGSRQNCTEPYGWSAWIVLSAVRLGLTAIVIVFYYALLVYYETTRRTTKWVNPANLLTSRRSGSVHSMPSPEISQVTCNPGVVIPALHQEASRSTVISSTSPSKKSSLRRSHSVVSVIPSPEPPFKYTTSIEPETGTEYGTTAIPDQSRSMFCRINHETDLTIALARSDKSSDSSSSSQPSSEQAYTFYPPPIPPSIGYNEFGQPYPPEESIPMLNGFIRRMPTIESMGSREVASTKRGSSAYSGSILDRLANTSNSRPPTRMSLCLSGSELPSRSNSTSQRVLRNSNGVGGNSYGMEEATEIGELISLSNERRGYPSPLSQTTFDLSSSSSFGAHGVNSQSSRASSTPTAYYTATVGSRSSVPSSTEEKEDS